MLRKIQIYVLLSSVITNVVAFVVGIALSGISYNFSIFPKKLSLPAEKKKVALEKTAEIEPISDTAQSFSIEGQTQVYELIIEIK